MLGWTGLGAQPLFPFERWFGVASVGLFIALVFGLLYAVPFLDRSERRRWQDRKIIIGVALAIVAIMLAISIWVWINNANGH